MINAVIVHFAYITWMRRVILPEIGFITWTNKIIFCQEKKLFETDFYR